MKKIYTAFIIICALIAFCSCVKPAENKQALEAAASVNGELITNEELAYFKGKLKAQVLNDYLQEYSVAYTPDFWSREFGGKTPEQALNEQALEKCVTAKLQLVLMRAKGIYTDISYQGLYNKALAFNEENIGKQGVVGLKSIKLEQFYSYYLDNGIMELRNILAENEIKPTAGEIGARVEQLEAAQQYPAETDLEAIAESKLILEKYDDYIAGIRSKAQVKSFIN